MASPTTTVMCMALMVLATSPAWAMYPGAMHARALKQGGSVSAVCCPGKDAASILCACSGSR